ncbi:MarR family transcriptional regulator [Sphingobium algorifonticola]|uniref:MarR family transcriptional regulator n=1 Tax=Sphingobium algorifonticola TaxID=2008318 RepID=A0A437JCU5_9SPHN|nr:MarR family transcriptional regulator [Sphingobium algorifonticola]RVT43748.1 MarR family transcriptional regulator [Sphingobium algorifonticola]
MTHEIMAFAHAGALEAIDSLSAEPTMVTWADRLVQSAPEWMQDRRPSMLVIADPAAHPRFAALAEGFGARQLGSVSLAQASDRLTRIADVDIILLDAADTLDLRVLLPQVAAMVTDGDSRLILATPQDALDATFSALAAHGLLDDTVQWLCAPDDADWAAAFALACRGKRRTMALHDVGRESDNNRLQRLSEDVERLARTLDQLRAGLAGDFGKAHGGNGRADGAVRDRNAAYNPPHAPGWPIVSSPAQGAEGEERMTAQTVRDLLRSRRLRDQFFGDDLFGDPAWDMMLDLMAARLAGERVSVSSLCIASAVPPTTALRWIRDLTGRGIFERRPDPLDGRRVFIALSDDAAEAMQRWYGASRRARREGSA